MKRRKKPEKRKPAAPWKKKPAGFKAGFADLIFVQWKILRLREADDYQAAEGQRQTHGSGGMATGTAAQQKAIRLMIETWESIANMVLAREQIGQETIFGGTPVGYMWDALRPGVLIIRQNDPGYATMFEQLDTAYDTWIGTKRAEYQSRAQQGLNAIFG